MNGITTAADHAWLTERYEGLVEAYCVTLVRGLTAEGLLRELRAEPAGRVTGVAALEGPSYEVDGHHRLLVGAATLDGWALMVEYNGYLGTLDEVLLPLSRGRAVVSHFHGVDVADGFRWFDDGTARLRFEPLFAHDRGGSHPDALLTEMGDAGFDLSDDTDDTDVDDRDRHRAVGAAFALAQRITGVRLTPELFAAGEFVCGVVPVPRG